MKPSLAVLAAVSFSLAGCAWYAPRTDVGQSLTYRSGNGVVESVSTAPRPFTAAAGGSAPDAPLYRLKVRMDNGQVQYIDTDATQFTRGTRVRLTDERLIEKP
jgi:hypothetical protein